MNKLIADFSNEDPQVIDGKRPAQLPESVPMEEFFKRIAMEERQPAQLDSPYMQEPQNLDSRREEFNKLLNQIQSSESGPEGQIAKPSGANLDKAIEERNRQQRMALLLKGFNQLAQAGARSAGADIGPGDAVANDMLKLADQGVQDAELKRNIKRQETQDMQASEKQQLVMEKLRKDLDQIDLNFLDAKATNDPGSPQSQFVQDQFIQMQTAMGKPVNEDAVRQQTAKTLYTVSPWMQKVYADQLKAKMTQQQAQRQERSLNLRERELDEYKLAKEDRLKDQFEKKFEEGQQEQSAKVVDKFEKDKVVQKSNESIAQADNVIQLVQSDNPIGHSAIPTFMARASGEVGNLSEADKAPFGGSQALNSRISQVIQKYRSGELTPENQEFVIDLANVMKNSARRNKVGRALDLRNKYAKSYKMDMKDVNSLMVPELNDFEKEDQDAIEWALKNPTSNQAQQILKMHGF